MHTQKPLQILPQMLCQENISIQEGISAAFLYNIINVSPQYLCSVAHIYFRWLYVKT